MTCVSSQMRGVAMNAINHVKVQEKKDLLSTSFLFIQHKQNKIGEKGRKEENLM
jgi:hypothetical protein